MAIDKQLFLEQLPAALELEETTITGKEKLADLSRWDSLAVIGFIAFVDENHGISVSPAGIREAVTIDDLFDLLTA